MFGVSTDDSGLCSVSGGDGGGVGPPLDLDLSDCMGTLSLFIPGGCGGGCGGLPWSVDIGVAMRVDVDMVEVLSLKLGNVLSSASIGIAATGAGGSSANMGTSSTTLLTGATLLGSTPKILIHTVSRQCSPNISLMFNVSSPWHDMLL